MKNRHPNFSLGVEEERRQAEMQLLNKAGGECLQRCAGQTSMFSTDPHGLPLAVLHFINMAPSMRNEGKAKDYAT